MQCITVQVDLLLKEECSALQVEILKNEWIALLIYIFLKEEYSVMCFSSDNILKRRVWGNGSKTV